MHYNTGRESKKPGLLVAKATVKGFDKPWSILIDSGASGNLDAVTLEEIHVMLRRYKYTRVI